MKKEKRDPTPLVEPLGAAAEAPESSGAARARQKLRRLWQRGDLFHNAIRHPRKRGQLPVDRLAGILRQGLLAPASCADGSVYSDLNLIVEGIEPRYDSLVFLHRFGDRSWLYTICEPGRFAVFVKPELAVLTPAEMGRRWVLLCQDEVYARDRVALEDLLGIAVHPDDAEQVRQELRADFERAGIPLYLYDGTVVWPASGAVEHP